jgi:hypothetical protein
MRMNDIADRIMWGLMIILFTLAHLTIVGWMAIIIWAVAR